MKKEKLKSRGITLIALIITIIVMLILVAVTLNVALSGGLIGKTQEAKTKTEYEEDREMLLSSVIGAINNDAEVDYEKLDSNLPEGFTKAEDGGYTSKAGSTFYVRKNGNITDEPPKTAAQLFDTEAEKITNVKKKEDADFTTDGNLHIGDFVNYDAGIWTDDEIKAIQVGPNDRLRSANNSTNKPSTAYAFGGFTVGMSRNENVKPYDNKYNYIKDEKGKEITGWRVLDIDLEQNTITLVSAGCPEDFNVPSFINYDDNGYISGFILGGGSTTTPQNIKDSYTTRNWEAYVNKGQKAINARMLSLTDLDRWYNKYTGGNRRGVQSNFNLVYKSRYYNLLYIYAHYWFATGSGSQRVWWMCEYPRYVDTVYDKSCGVRVLVFLDSNVVLEKSGEKTVADFPDDELRCDKSYTYNVWDIVD